MSDQEFEAGPPSFETLASQIEQLRDGTLDAVQQQRLLKQLREDPRARQFYVQYQFLHADLCAALEFDGQTAVSEEPATTRPKISGVSWSSLPMPMWARVLVILLVAMTFTLGSYWGLRQLRKRPADFAQVVASPPFARLVATMDAAWPERASLAAGQSLASMPVQLQSGLAEIRFSSGASIVLQGPARCELESPSSVRLLHGRLSASVPERAIGFSVRTPLANVVDLGTEFAIHSTPAGNTDVHVFRGQVALGGSRLSGDSGHELLGAGNAKRFKGDGGEAEEFRADELAFVSYQEFEARRKAEQDSPYYRWLCKAIGSGATPV